MAVCRSCHVGILLLRTDVASAAPRRFPRQATFSSAVQVASRRHEVLEQVYHSADVFRRDFREMEENFKVYVYPDGDLETCTFRRRAS